MILHQQQNIKQNTKNKKRKLTIILRTCSRVFALHGHRYINKSKLEIIRTCFSSLVNSINQTENHEVEFFVLDDHSDEESIVNIKNIINKCKFKIKLIHAEGTGPSYTCYQVYSLVEKYCTDLWYHIEDDYLHFPTAIQDMIDTINLFEFTTGKMVSINPHDDVWRYTRQVYESKILLGPYRHYRTVRHTTYTCLSSKEIYNKYRQHFQDAAKWILKKREDYTINKVWNKSDVMLVSPIPTLALHIMTENGKDPYVDFDALWNSIPEFWN